MLEPDEIHNADGDYYIMSKDGAVVLLEWIRFNTQLLEIQGLVDEDADGEVNNFDKWILMFMVLREYCQAKGWDIFGQHAV